MDDVTGPRLAAVGLKRMAGVVPQSLGAWGLFAVGVLAVGVFVGGCQKELFANEDARTPFDSFDRRRSQEAVPYVFDPFGQRRPNLRQRLLPKD